MNQLKVTVHGRSSKAAAADVKNILASIYTPCPASFHECLESALSVRGEIKWSGVKDMVRVLQQELVSPVEALRILKPYLKSNLATVILKILTIVDTLVLNCGEKVYIAMLLEKWHTRISRLTSHVDNKVKQSALQLISNYSQIYHGTEFGDGFADVAVSLTTKGFLLPRLLGSTQYGKKQIDSANIDDAFMKGIDFLDLLLPESSSSSASSRSDQVNTTKEILLTAEKIHKDSEKLAGAISRCYLAGKKFKSGESLRKDVLDSLNLARTVAERCHVWSENMQLLLTRELRQQELSALLAANDNLDKQIRSWDALLSMDITNSCSSDSESQSTSSSGRVQRRPMPSSSNQDIDRLRNENERLRIQLSDMEMAQKSAVLNVEARYKSLLKDVKNKAACRIKSLLSQVAQSEIREKRLERDLEDLMLRLRNSDHALEDKSKETGRLEGIQRDLELGLEQARKYQMSLEEKLNAETNLNAELAVKLANLQDELETEKARAAAESAAYLSQIDQLTREVGRLTKEVESSQKSLSKIEEYESSVASLKAELKRESILRKKVFNHIRELKGNVRVLARIRPAFDSNADVVSTAYDEYTIEHLVKTGTSLDGRRSYGDGVKRYEFDACFGPDATQAAVYEETRNLIQSAKDGYNVCIFCYGQTGSGKTHTLTGSRGDPGILPRFMEDIFRSESSMEKTSVSCYMLELYRDDLVDLLSPTSVKGKMSIRSDPNSGLVTVKGATLVDVRDAADMKSTFDCGLKRRKTAATRCNINSSRSHLIFTVFLESSNIITGSKTKSKITFIDLAGSERVFKSGAVNDKERLNEAKAINKSLSALGDVVSALTSQEAFVPYRNHKLTELMRDSLGGNAKTLMIVNISCLETDAKETQNSLDYAQRAKLVTNEESRSFETRELAKLRAINEKQTRELQQLKAAPSRS